MSDSNFLQKLEYFITFPMKLTSLITDKLSLNHVVIKNPSFLMYLYNSIFYRYSKEIKTFSIKTQIRELGKFLRKYSEDAFIKLVIDEQINCIDKYNVGEINPLINYLRSFSADLDRSIIFTGGFFDNSNYYSKKVDILSKQLGNKNNVPYFMSMDHVQSNQKTVKTEECSYGKIYDGKVVLENIKRIGTMFESLIICTVNQFSYKEIRRLLALNIIYELNFVKKIDLIYPTYIRNNPYV